MEEGVMTNVEVRRASEIEQEVADKTGFQRKKFHLHLDEYKQDRADGKDDQFGRAYTKARKAKPNPT
jgi:hypothetical protein